MSKNALYNLIRDRSRFSYVKKPTDITLLAQVHKSGAGYFLFPLSPAPISSLSGYRVTEHHLSVYERPLSALDAKSQYHYTALMQKEGIEYRLHVYFDANDMPVGRPNLAEITLKKELITLDCKKNAQEFLQLAIDSRQNLIGFLRVFQDTVCKNLESQYKKCEAIAKGLAQDTPLNKLAYLEILQQQTNLLNQIIQYSKYPTLFGFKLNALYRTLTSLLDEDMSTDDSDEEIISCDKEERVELIAADSTQKTGYQFTYFKQSTERSRITPNPDSSDEEPDSAMRCQ
ncbi:hypothetical protein [Legionella worsleiensis]|uniref:Uncharacterized protein n=1 Tax=Legionella worsleiensis TaxID=45076 RepID=A0A0W1A5U9_9GAMM|nr:hypothetical protein [Legionella worsleiensis]KTD76715.1 hypothetical protein Lwor_1940 [Legionella worsleiensis]STY30498.1 Uncharacterised protein [Legionella worsleiensis]